MTLTHATAPDAIAARELVESLQQQFVARLQQVSRRAGSDQRFEPVAWLRDSGQHGGGTRFVAGDTPVFNRASVNVSQVHYEDMPDKRLSSATALSTIIHPHNPHAPSVHMHISWTRMRDGTGYWRMMADLNPSIPESADKPRFCAALERAASTQYEYASAQGDRYFFIPALKRHRGIAHFYLEGYHTDDSAADAALARSFGEQMIDCYAGILGDALERHPTVTDADRARQLVYHTVYLFQVLTLDRGTTSGLLVHDQNDVGILGSLPAHVDRALLASWAQQAPAPQDRLVRAITAALDDASPCPVTIEAKQALAHVVRGFYKEHPQALAMQASGDIVPPTVANHQ